MSEYIKKSSIIGLAHKMQFGRILTEREVEVVEMVVNSVSDDALVDLVRCRECLFQRGCKSAQYLGDDGYCSHGERKGGEDDAAD